MLRKGVVLFAHAEQRGRRSPGSEVPALEQVANRPIAHHVIDALLGAAIDDLIVAGTADVLLDVRESLLRYSPQPARLKFAVCPEQFDIGNALEVVHSLVGAAPCVVHLADGLLGEPLSPHLDGMQRTSADLLLFRRDPGSDPGSNGSPPPGIRRGSRANGCVTAGVIAFGPGALTRACESRTPGPEWAPQALAEQLQEGGGRVHVTSGEGWRRYGGNAHDLLELNRLALDGLTLRVPNAIKEQNRIEGCVDIDSTASVTDSIIVGPAVIGPGVRIVSAYIGPYTSIGAGARVEGTEIERSIICPGAAVLHVGGRLSASLVGANARIFRDFSLPRALRFRVSAGDEVALC